MADYRTDLDDIFFNLINILKVHEVTEDLDESSLREIISEFDKFTGNEIYPARMSGDTEGVSLKDGKVTAPPSFQTPKEQFYENGWFGLGYPEDLGGMPVPHAVTVACTSIGVGANIAFSMYPGLSQGAFNVIRTFGSDFQKKKYLPPMMTGEFGGTMCLTEANAGSDVGSVASTAVPLAIKDEDGDVKSEPQLYSIKGVKIFISSGDSDLYDNNIHLVLARTPNAPAGAKGLSLFIVPKLLVSNTGASGSFNHVSCTKIEEKMGIHGSATCELTFGTEGECLGEMIGAELEGMKCMFLMMNEARLLCGVQGQSQASLAFELSQQYARERVQFGKEIIKHPDIKRTLLIMRASSRGMRALSLYVGNLFDRHSLSLDDHTDKSATAQPTSSSPDSEIAQEIALLTPICKAYMSDQGFAVTVEAMQVHGGYGYCQEYGIEQFVRDTKIASIYEGTNGIQAVDFVMRKIMGDNGKQFMAIGAKMTATMQSKYSKSTQEFSHELAMMGKSMEMTTHILKKFATMAAAKNFDGILAHATDFLRYCGHIVIAWQLLVHACEAKRLLADDSTSGEFLQSKINDFKIFCQFKLIENIGVANSILNFDEDLISLDV